MQGRISIYELLPKDETWPSTTFLISASVSGVTLPDEIFSRRACWEPVKCVRKSLSQAVILSTGIESSWERYVEWENPPDSGIDLQDR